MTHRRKVIVRKRLRFLKRMGRVFGSEEAYLELVKEMKESLHREIDAIVLYGQGSPGSAFTPLGLLDDKTVVGYETTPIRLVPNSEDRTLPEDQIDAEEDELHSLPPGE